MGLSDVFLSLVLRAVGVNLAPIEGNRGFGELDYLELAWNVAVIRGSRAVETNGVQDDSYVFCCICQGWRLGWCCPPWAWWLDVGIAG